MIEDETSKGFSKENVTRREVKETTGVGNRGRRRRSCTVIRICNLAFAVFEEMSKMERDSVGEMPSPRGGLYRCSSAPRFRARV